MTQDDARFIVALAEFALQQAEMQSMTIKMVLQRFDNVERLQHLRDRMANLPDLEGLQQLRAEMQEFERAQLASTATLSAGLLDALAQGESQRDQVAAALASLRASLVLPPTSD